MLQLKARLGHSFTRDTFETLFYSCPSSLFDLKIACQISRETVRYSRDPVVGDWDYNQGPLVLRDTPLLHLKSLDIPVMPLRDLALVYGTVFRQCPALEPLALPKIQSQ